MKLINVRKTHQHKFKMFQTVTLINTDFHLPFQLENNSGDKSVYLEKKLITLDLHSRNSINISFSKTIHKYKLLYNPKDYTLTTATNKHQ